MRFLKALAVLAAFSAQPASAVVVEGGKNVPFYRAEWISTYGLMLPETDTRPETWAQFTVVADAEGLGGLLRGTCKQVGIGACADWSVIVDPGRVPVFRLNGEVFNVEPPTFKHVRTRVVASSTVPEPATWALIILGFGAIGAALRMRPRHIAATA